MFQKVSLVFLAIVTLVPCYIKYKLLKKFKEKLLFKTRHNCVIMYKANKSMTGWNSQKYHVQLNINEESYLNALYEPIIYFIDTANRSLDIAYMMICIQQIYDALIEAHKRGVKVRLLMDFDYCENNWASIRECVKEGLEVQFYISRTSANVCTIMHYKYMLKDYTENGGYLVIGSMNLTKTAFLNNYEDLVFIFDSYLARSIYNNFEKCWKYVEAENKTLLNRTVLNEVNLL